MQKENKIKTKIFFPGFFTNIIYGRGGCIPSLLYFRGGCDPSDGGARDTRVDSFWVGYSWCSIFLVSHALIFLRYPIFLPAVFSGLCTRRVDLPSEVLTLLMQSNNSFFCVSCISIVIPINITMIWEH